MNKKTMWTIGIIFGLGVIFLLSMVGFKVFEGVNSAGERDKSQYKECTDNDRGEFCCKTIKDIFGNIEEKECRQFYG